MTALLAVVLAVTAGTLVKVAADLLTKEIGGWLAPLSRAIVRRATRRLPAESRARWEEEALRHLEEYDERPLSAVVHALLALKSAGRLNTELGEASRSPAPNANRRGLLARLLPSGVGDVALQFTLFAAAYWVYQSKLNVSLGTASVHHGNAVAHAERALHLYLEPSLQSWSIHTGVLDPIASWAMINCSFVVTTVALAWMYLFRNEQFYFVRNMLLVALAVGCLGTIVYPVAPPRMFPQRGFVDSVAHFTGGQPAADSVNLWSGTPFLIAYSMLISASMILSVRRRWTKAMWIAYAPWTVFVAIVTANDWMLGAIGAGLAAALAGGAALMLGWLRPNRWSWSATGTPVVPGWLRRPARD